MIAGEVVGTITDELIIRLIGGDDDAHVRVIDHREKLASIAKWRGTVNGDVLGAILAFDSKFRKLPKTLDALDEFGIDTIGAPNYGHVTSGQIRDFLEADVQFRFAKSSLEVLIDAAYEEFQVERLCEDLKCPHCNKPG